MSEDWGKKVKKLALAYETGWEYMAKSDEAGSVLTDAFLEMEGRNRDRCRGMWEKHEREFLQAVPAEDGGARRLRTALVVKAAGNKNGTCLRKGTKAYTVLEKGGLIRFRTCSDLTLTSARLKYAVYQKGLSAWLAYDSGEDGVAEEQPVHLFQAVGGELAHPVLEWSFRGLCDGREGLSVQAEFCGNSRLCTQDSGAGLSGVWSVTDGEEVYPLSLEQTDAGFALRGETPGFAGKLDGRTYTVRLELPAGVEPPREWQEALCGDLVLKEAADTVAPGLCLTDEGAAEADCVKPFGQALYEASCCYFVCDRAAAGREGELVIRFTEAFETEEELPEPPAQEYEKLCRKYPWMRLEQTVQEWHAQDTVWEYFNGSLWRVLPGSGGWKTGCNPDKTGERSYRWTRPQDMQPCAVEGEVHFYIRLRLASVRNAFAVYYRKRVPVMKDIRFETRERSLKSIAGKRPGREEWRETKMYLGFDGKVTSENTWYTGEERLAFEQGQIQGQDAGAAGQTRYGREAFWVEIEGGRAKDWKILQPNYVEILQEEDGQGGPSQEGTPQSGPSQEENPQSSPSQEGNLQIPAASSFAVEDDNMAILDAVSVTDARYGGDGRPVESRKRVEAAEHYFAHYGRLVTRYDMELLLQERYPSLRVASCALREDPRTLQVSLRQTAADSGETRELLLEIGEWLERTISRIGPLWLKGACVDCSLLSEEAACGGEEK